MFTGPDPALQSLLRGLLAAAAALYAVGTGAIVIAIRAEPARARFYARLAGIAKIGPFLVGVACIGFVMDAVDLRSGHEADVMARWPALLSQTAALSAGAGFLAGLLAAARPIWVALATGGLMAVLSLLFWAVAGWFLVALWREDATIIGELQRSAPPSFVAFFVYLALFPLVTIAAAAAGAGIGRLLHTLLGLPSAAEAADPVVQEAVGTAPTLPASRETEVAASRTDRRPAAVPRRSSVSTTTWPGILLIAFGTFALLTAGCDLLTPKARLSASEPAGGAMLSAAPSDVALTFSDELSPSSKVSVHRTVTLDETGQQLHTGGTPVADASGLPALSADRRTLRVRLPEGLPGGLYVVDWNTVRARGRAERFGDLYFGVRMPVPHFIRGGGGAEESGPGERNRRTALAGGIVLILIGLAWRWYGGAVRGQ
jgi:methionine-rich copper-binding protein CopC